MEDRVENWKKFAEHMEKYIQERTVEKYGVKNSDESGSFDLMSITRNPLICVWNILTVLFTDLERETKNP